MSRRTASVILFGLLLFSYSYINQGWGWNQNSRLDLLHAIVVKGTLAIDGYDDNTGDKAEINGHKYSEKAPGVALVALPWFALTYAVLTPLGIDIDKDLGWKISEWVATIGSVGLLTALGGLCMFLLLSKKVGEKYALIATLAVFLGSMPFPYATMMFSHGAVMGLFSIALWAIVQAGERKKSPEVFGYLAGACLGLAIASEYPASIGSLGLLLLAFSYNWRHGLRVMAGAVIPLLLIPAYDYAISGSFLSLGYSHVSGFEGMKEGFFGITLPKPSVMWAILFSQFRGLFFWSPFLLLAIPGYFKLWKVSRRLFWVTLLVPVAYLFFVSSYVYWDGGYAFGPRHLSAAVPLLLLVAAFGLPSWPRLGALFAAASMCFTGFATFINGILPNSELKPLVEFYPKEFIKGNMAMNLGRSMGLSNGWSFVPYLVVLTAVSVYLLRKFGALDWSLSLEKKKGPTVSQFTIVKLALLKKFTRNFSRRKKRVPKSRDRFFQMILWILLGISLLMRFMDLSYVEFKGDEFQAFLLSYRHVRGTEFALAGLQSSIGVFNPPFFIWFLSFPVSLFANPVWVSGYIALVNVIAVVVLYFFLKKFFSAQTALWTVVLFATAPWVFVFSRKIWAQDVLFPFMILLYFSFFLDMKRPRWWTTIVFFLLLGIVTQLHMSVWLLPIVILVFLDLCKAKVKLWPAATGILLLALLYVPYALFQAHSNFDNILGFLRGNSHILGFADIWNHLCWSLSVTTGLRFDYLLGQSGLDSFSTQYAIIAPVSIFFLYILGVLAALLFYALTAAKNWRSLLRPSAFSLQGKILLLLTMIYVITLGYYILRGIPAYPHYHIIFYPFFTLLFVLFLEKVSSWHRLAPLFARSLILLIVAANMYFTFSFMQFIHSEPEKITGDYGAPYALKKQEWQKKFQVEKRR